jgi:hypothetical protein
MLIIVPLSSLPATITSPHNNKIFQRIHSFEIHIKTQENAHLQGVKEKPKQIELWRYVNREEAKLLQVSKRKEKNQGKRADDGSCKKL